MELFDLEDKVAVVTGSSRGLGRLMAGGLAAAGARIVISGRNREQVEETASDFGNAGYQVEGVAFDAKSRADCQRLIDTAVDRFGRLDVLVANHGGGQFDTALDLDDKAWAETLATNLTGVFYCCQIAARQMVAQGEGGSIVVVSSTASTVAFPQLLAYGTSKAGIDQMVRQMASEWGEYQIRVNAINPGYTTHRPRGPEYDAGSETEQAINNATPLGRSGLSEEFVGPIVFLASAASSYITGTTLPVDGGYLIR